jgi:hypothetical protein
MVGLARFELATTGLGNRCSIHLSYSPNTLRDFDSLPATVPIFTHLLESPSRPYLSNFQSPVRLFLYESFN